METILCGARTLTLKVLQTIFWVIEGLVCSNPLCRRVREDEHVLWIYFRLGILYTSSAVSDLIICRRWESLSASYRRYNQGLVDTRVMQNHIAAKCWTLY